MIQIVIAVVLSILLVSVLWQGFETRKKFPSLKAWAEFLMIIYIAMTALLVTMIFMVERPNHQSILERFTQSGATIIFVLLSILLLLGMREKRRKA